MSNDAEIERLKNKFIKMVENLVNEGKIEDAKRLIRQFRRAVPNTIELIATEAVISLTEGNLLRAEQVLKMGLLVDDKNPDLLFNYGYLYELKEEYSNAILYYSQAHMYGDYGLKNQINEIIANIQKNYNTGDSIQSSNLIEQRNPKVSVLIPTYNMKEYLKEAIDSILNQDYESLEIVVGDDCSTDGTDEMMKQYSGNEKVRYIRNDNNLGPSGNSKMLIYEHARGKYLLGINHDDYLIESDYISRAVTILDENPNVSLVCANVKILKSSTGKIYGTTNLKLKNITNGIDYFINYQMKEYPPIPSTLTSIYRVEDAIRIGCLLENVYSQDTFLYLKLMLLGDVAFIDSYAGVYRVHSSSLTYNMPTDKDTETIEEFERLYAFAIMRGLDKEALDQWLQARIVSYIKWRIDSIWSSNKQYALELMLSVSETYTHLFDYLTSNLKWEKQ